MVSKRTHKMGLLAALALSGSMSVACGAASNESGTDEPTISADNNVATENVQAPESGEPTVDPAADGAEIVNEQVSEAPTSEETGENLAVEGAEGQDEGFASTLEANPTPEMGDAEAAAAAEAGDDEVGQQSEALLSTRGASLASEARRIASYTTRSSSYYSHSTYMNESTGTRRADCSGLVDYILSRKSPSGYALLPRTEGGVRPVARDIVNYLAGRPTTASTQSSARWRKISYARNLKPGDIVGYAYSSGQTTGHVMMVSGTPYRGRSYEWIVPVVDSAMSGHASDSRGTSYTGPGTGKLGIKVNSAGTPVGYYWRGGQSTTLNTTKIVMGRLE